MRDLRNQIPGEVCDQTTAASKVSRVDFGDCEPPQPLLRNPRAAPSSPLWESRVRRAEASVNAEGDFWHSFHQRRSEVGAFNRSGDPLPALARLAPAADLLKIYPPGLPAEMDPAQSARLLGVVRPISDCPTLRALASVLIKAPQTPPRHGSLSAYEVSAPR